MNKNYTLKELADVGLSAACQFEPNSNFPLSFQNYREAFTKAVLDAIGYEFPKDEEKEAFDAWWKVGNSQIFCDAEEAFKAWKAGREELRRAQAVPVCAANPDAKPKEPAWIPWDGGECPLPDTVKKWEFMLRDGREMLTENKPSDYRDHWLHSDILRVRQTDIVAYRVWEG